MLTATSILFDSRIQKEAKSLVSAGYEVTILSIEDQGLSASLNDEAAILKALVDGLPGVRFQRYFLISRTWRFLPNVVNKAIQAIELFIKLLTGVLRNRAQIYHCHDLIPAIFSWIGKWIYGAAIVYDAHELEIEMSGATGLSKKVLRWYEEMMLRFSSLNITVNEEIRKFMEGAYGKRVNVIQNRPYYFSPDQLDKSKLRMEVPLNPEDRIVMYVGYLSFERGIGQLVSALAFLEAHIHVVIMGTGRVIEFKQQLNSILEEQGISSGRVHFIGPFPPSDVIPFLCGADISALLYQRVSDNAIYNAPNKLYQSIIAQVPILACNNATFPPLIEPSSGGNLGVIVDESDPQAVAAGILKLLDPEVQEACRKHLAFSAVNVSWKQEETKLLELYKSLDS